MGHLGWFWLDQYHYQRYQTHRLLERYHNSWKYVASGSNSCGPAFPPRYLDLRHKDIRDRLAQLPY